LKILYGWKRNKRYLLKSIIKNIGCYLKKSRWRHKMKNKWQKKLKIFAEVIIAITHSRFFPKYILISTELLNLCITYLISTLYKNKPHTLSTTSENGISIVLHMILNGVFVQLTRLLLRVHPTYLENNHRAVPYLLT
jgi:hypothetical protein